MSYAIRIKVGKLRRGGFPGTSVILTPQLLKDGEVIEDLHAQALMVEDDKRSQGSTLTLVIPDEWCTERFGRRHPWRD